MGLSWRCWDALLSAAGAAALSVSAARVWSLGDLIFSLSWYITTERFGFPGSCTHVVGAGAAAALLPGVSRLGVVRGSQCLGPCQFDYVGYGVGRELLCLI